MKKLYCTILVSAALMLAAGSADAATRVYTSPKYIFSTDDVQCDTSLFGTGCLEAANPLIDADFFKDTYTHYAIDSAYGFDVRDFDPGVAMDPLPRDGIYEEGYVADILDGYGNVTGIHCKNNETPGYLTGMLKGEVMAGLGGAQRKSRFRALLRHGPHLQRAVDAAAGRGDERPGHRRTPESGRLYHPHEG